MSESASFHDLIQRVRGGDEEAATELVRQYEPAIRRAVRFRLTDVRVRRVLDSADICQSVLASFFVRAALGQYELDTPAQLIGLLVRMARNKLVNQVQREQADCRDNRRLAAAGIEETETAAAGPTPSMHLAAKELLAETLRRLSPEERRVLELKEQGLDWAAIAARVGGSPEALRKRLARSVDRIADELGLDR